MFDIRQIFPLSTPKSPKPHPLDKVPPTQVLSTCFRALRILYTFSGALPITINSSGFASFRLISWPILFYLFYIAGFTTTAILYVPLYLNKTAQLQDNLVNQISENLFLGGQLVGVVCTILFIPLIARDVAKLWNKMVLSVEFIVTHGYRNIFRQSYKKSRIFLLVFLIVMHAYGIICWMDFSAGSLLEEKHDKKSFLYWLNALGLVSFFGMCFFHIVHCLILQFFVFFLKSTFEGLNMYAREFVVGSKQSKVYQNANRGYRSINELKELVSVYLSICEVCKDISNAFGLYLVLEVTVLMTSCLMNVFTMLSEFKQRDPWSTTMGFVGNIILLFILAEGGEKLHRMALECIESIREAVYESPYVDGTFTQKVGRLEAPYLNAASYFVINRSLLTSMAGTFATYFVVMIQFKLNASPVPETK